MRNVNTMLIAVTFAVAAALLLAALPAEAAYISPDQPWQLQAFCQRGC